MKPLRVQIRLVEPVAGGAFPRLLDGLLAACAVEDALMFADDLDDARPLRALGDDLPLAHAEHEGEKVWKASAWMPLGRVTADCGVDEFSLSGSTESRLLTRKTDAQEFASLMGEGFIRVRGFDPSSHKPYAMQINTGSGLLKEYSFRYQLKSVSAIEAWCIGDPEAIEALLKSHVEFFGAKRRLGHGRVHSITVEEDPRAEALWRLRPLPAGMVDRGGAAACANRVPTLSPARAPYWDARFSIEQHAPAAMFW